MAHRIEIGAKVADTRTHLMKQRIHSFGFSPEQVQSVEVVDVYTVDKDLTAAQLDQCGQSLANPVTQLYRVNKAYAAIS